MQRMWTSDEEGAEYTEAALASLTVQLAVSFAAGAMTCTRFEIFAVGRSKTYKGSHDRETVAGSVDIRKSYS